MVKLPISIPIEHREEQAVIVISQTKGRVKFDLQLVYGTAIEEVTDVPPSELPHQVSRLSDVFFEFVQHAYVFGNPEEFSELDEEDDADLSVEDLPPLDQALAAMSKMGYDGAER